VYEDDGLHGLFAEQKAVTGREGADLAWLAAAGVLGDVCLGGEILDPAPVADGVDRGDARGVLEGTQGVVEGGPAEELYELLGATHPAAHPPGEHERDR
jgi:hypothetical protein